MKSTFVARTLMSAAVACMLAGFSATAQEKPKEPSKAEMKSTPKTHMMKKHKHHTKMASAKMTKSTKESAKAKEAKGKK